MQKRLIVLGILFAVYFMTFLINTVIEDLHVFRNNQSVFSSGINILHFKQPQKSPFSLTYLPDFLSRITDNKNNDGVLSSKIFYSVLLLAYILLTTIIFTRLLYVKRDRKVRFTNE